MALDETEMPARQTYPHIKGQIKDQVGVVDFRPADELSLHLQVDDESDLIVLMSDALDPEDPASVFLDENGDEQVACFESPIGNSGLSDVLVETTYEAKLEAVWDASSNPPLRTFYPRTGFMKVTITRNVQAEA